MTNRNDAQGTHGAAGAGPGLPARLSPPVVADFLSGGGEMGARMRAHHWSGSPLGEPESWPSSLRSVIALMINSRYPMFVAWGPELAFLYNDAYIPIFGGKHPRALGLPFRQVWSDIWDDVRPLVERALTGESVYYENLHLVMERNDHPEDTWYSFSYSPVRDESGAIAGMFCACTETTEQVLTDRRQKLRLELSDRLRDIVDPAEIMAAAAGLLGRYFDAARAGYAELEPDGAHTRVEQDWRKAGMPSIAGRYHLESYGAELEAEYRAGRAVVIEDFDTDSRSAGLPAAAAHAAIGVRAQIAVPLIKEDRLSALLFVHSDEPRRWLEQDVALVREVAERTWAAVEAQRAVAALAEREERLRLVVDSAADHAIFTTDTQRVITTWSTGAANIFGLSAAEAIGRCADMLWTAEDRAAGRPQHETETASEVGCANDERWHQRPDGGRVFLNGSVHPLPPGEDGRVQGFIKIARDETARRATEEALHDAEARFRFLDTLGKATQGENHPEAIMAAVTRLLGEHLEVDICAYADVAPDGDAFTIRRDWTAPGVPSIVGSYSLDTFGGVAAAAQRAGVPLVVRDAVGELGAEQAATFTSIGVAATICLPLVKNGRLAAMMAVHSATPRDWTDAEVTLVAEVVERCWAHVERVGAEAELRERENRFRDLADNMPTLCWWADATGYIFWYNRRWYEYTGTEPADMEGWGWQTVHDPECLPEVMERWPASIATGDPFRMTFPLRGADGVFRPFLTRAVPLRDESGAIVRWFGTNTDISEQREVEEALRDSEARLQKVNAEQQAILSQLTEGVIVTDAAGRIIFVNEAAKQLHGVEALDVEPSEYAETYHLYREDGSPHPFEELPLARAVINGETVVDARWRIRRPDGTDVLAIGSAQPISDAANGRLGSVLTVRDDTRRYEAEIALRAESRILETLNRTGASLAAELDLEKVVQMVTDAGVELTGAKFGAFFYNVPSETGESMMLFTLSGAHASQFDFGMPRATAIFSPTFQGEGVIRSDDILIDPRYGKSAPHHGMPKGHLPVRSYLAVPVTSRSSEVIGGLFFGHPAPGRFTERHERLLVGVAAQAAISIDNARLYQSAQRELEERVKAEERLRDLNDTLEQRVGEEVARRSAAEEQLRQMQKMETLGQLTGGVAHDFNNLLQIVTGNLEILQRNLGEDQARLRRSAENAMRGAERAAVLTQRLLAFARRQPLEPSPISLNRLVSGMSELMHRTLGETYEIETVLASGLWGVEADPNQLENAIINLAVNARDAMPGGGKLTIETSNTHLDHAYAAQNTGIAPGQYVVICVSDTGAGMDAATLERAFEPFFTTKDVGRGTGLGLSMVYGFVKQSGGHVKIYSEAGQGTTVKLYLPRLIGAVAEEEKVVEPLIPEGTREETILVCEDDDDVRTYSVEVLRELGYRVLEAHDGPSALRLLERQEGEVELLFTDVVLPSGMMGNELADQARKMRPGLKVLFTTGYARNAIVHHGRLDPGVELITKPFTYADLAARIRDLLDGN